MKTFIWENPNKDIPETARMIAFSKSLKKFSGKPLTLTHLRIALLIAFFFGMCAGLIIAIGLLEWRG